uniref:Protein DETOXIFICATION n=1 Tax=Kalanchoe fedtschenkoi TaxID=63787 RepID=A0A7N0T5L4_KALFE
MSQQQPQLSAATDACEAHRSMMPPPAASTSFAPDKSDIQQVNGLGDSFDRELLYVETKMLWRLAGPVIFMSTCQYSFGAVILLLARGHVGIIALAAVAAENSVIAGFFIGAMLGKGCAPEKLRGQAFGAGQIDMLRVYMRRSWVILNSAAILLLLFYISPSTSLLKLIGQETEIREAVGTFAVYMTPQLFAFAFNFPIAKFLQAQSKAMAMAVIAGAVLVLHTLLSWLLMVKLGWGLVGAAIALNSSWVLIALAKMAYAVSGTCGLALPGISFQNLEGLFQLSFTSAAMVCLETWHYMTLILFAGYLMNKEIAVDALSIFMNIVGWAVMMAIGFNAAISVRVSAELGAAHPRTAKFSVLAGAALSTFIGLILSLVLILTRSEHHHYPSSLAEISEVKSLVDKLTPVFAACIVISNLQPILSGAAVGAGRQAFAAYVNIACHYLFGMPMGVLLGYKLGLGTQGIWTGLISGAFVQTSILLLMIYMTNRSKEVTKATRGPASFSLTF